MKMNKLIELLNEYETPLSWYTIKSFDDYDGQYFWVDCDGKTEIILDDSYVCSKKFGFIKRLVDNDKIDESKIEIHWFSFYESVLMQLAIQGNQIEFLISILK
jgi:hypothetical protein